ncbi:hypothetical protein bthur0014_63640 [Bacillus thuringiensis IBL 4222]|nr:hypothetical protein bthur0014_63640 [Bacillus thuringiensis IBL 4222]
MLLCDECISFFIFYNNGMHSYFFLVHMYDFFKYKRLEMFKKLMEKNT